MQYGIRKGLEDIAHELKGIKNILSAFWQQQNTETNADVLNPQAYADEYISTEECARRLDVSDQTIRNWMGAGKKDPMKGWVEGIHYVNITPDPNRKAVLRIPWNNLIISFGKNRNANFRDYLPHSGPPVYTRFNTGQGE
jgi:hypothetical protein